MPHFFVPRKNLKGAIFTFDPSESYHLAKVLRKKAGTIVEIFDGEGGVHSAKILDVSNESSVKAEILDRNEKGATVSPLRKLSVFPALLKGERFEWLLEKLTELGVTKIAPVTTKRTIVQLKPDQVPQKMDRWQKIVLAAAKQSGRKQLPELIAPALFQDSLKELQSENLNLILWEGEEERRLSKILENENTKPVLLYLGPEGGFEINELQAALMSGAISVRLGDAILRAETAALAAVARILL